MTLKTGEFIRRFLQHILPDKLHRIGHCGFLANAVRAEKLTQVREELSVPSPVEDVAEDTEDPTFVCKACGTALLIVEVIKGINSHARAPPTVDMVIG